MTLIVALPGCVKDETHYSAMIARRMGARAEARLFDGSRVDVLTGTHAIEVDWAGKSLKWAEAIGQALYYARVSGRQPGIILLVRGARLTDAERRNVYRCLVAAPCRVWVVRLPELKQNNWRLGP